VPAKVAQEPATVSDMEAANMVQLPNDPTATTGSSSTDTGSRLSTSR
jgi:hypothetical protein